MKRGYAYAIMDAEVSPTAVTAMGVMDVDCGPQNAASHSLAHSCATQERLAQRKRTCGRASIGAMAGHEVAAHAARLGLQLPADAAAGSGSAQQWAALAELNALVAAHPGEIGGNRWAPMMANRLATPPASAAAAAPGADGQCACSMHAVAAFCAGVKHAQQKAMRGRPNRDTHSCSLATPCTLIPRPNPPASNPRSTNSKCRSISFHSVPRTSRYALWARYAGQHGVVAEAAHAAAAGGGGSSGAHLPGLLAMVLHVIGSCLALYPDARCVRSARRGEGLHAWWALEASSAAPCSHAWFVTAAGLMPATPEDWPHPATHTPCPQLHGVRGSHAQLAAGLGGPLGPQRLRHQDQAAAHRGGPAVHARVQVRQPREAREFLDQLHASIV